MATVCAICQRSVTRGKTRYCAITHSGARLPGLFVCTGWGEASNGTQQVICGDLDRHRVSPPNWMEADSACPWVQLVHQRCLSRVPTQNAFPTWWTTRIPYLHVVTWNVLAPTWFQCRRHADYKGVCESERAYTQRLTKIGRRLHTLHADLYLLQEVDEIVWAYLTRMYEKDFYLHREWHEERHWVPPGQQQLPPRNGNAVMVRKSAVPEHSTLTYQRISLSPNGNVALTVQWQLASGHTLSMLNVHLEDIDKQVRQEQYECIHQWRSKQTTDVHGIGGDFNDSQAWKHLRGYGKHRHITYSDPDKQDPDQAIDFILMSPATDIRCTQHVHTQRQPWETWGSDHVPVSLWLRAISQQTAKK